MGSYIQRRAVSFAHLFSDTFVRANVNHGPGTSYMIMSQPGGNGTTYVRQGNARIITNQFECFAETGTGGQAAATVFIPKTLINMDVYGVAQFAQMTYYSQSNFVDAGPAVMISGAFSSQDEVHYMITYDTGILQLNRYNGLTRAGLATAVYTAAQGDVWRIEVVPGASSNVITCKINGVTVISYTDNSGSRPIQTGYPGIAINDIGIGRTRVFSAFSAGLL